MMYTPNLFRLRGIDFSAHYIDCLAFTGDGNQVSGYHAGLVE
ncbi:hypothetical protein N5056_13810 [Pectobacterium aroidearum]|nr:MULTISPECIES: hypothetical protein [Pectobacterium]UXJ98898.1 hypothetical protein N5056_13810 [Pectobacterium aroidearum]